MKYGNSEVLGMGVCLVGSIIMLYGLFSIVPIIMKIDLLSINFWFNVCIILFGYVIVGLGFIMICNKKIKVKDVI